MSDAAVVLAAGKGTRMRSNLPKVLHQVAGKPMLERVLDGLAAAGFVEPTVVVGYGAELIRHEIGDRCHYVDQGTQLGTGHAASAAMAALPESVSRVLLIHGDEPMIEPDTYRAMLDLQSSTRAPVVLLTAHVSDTQEFGRVVRGADGNPVALVQQSDLTPEQLSLDEINLGVYVFDAGFLRENLPELQPQPPKGEYYLTDLIAVAARVGGRAEGERPAGRRADRHRGTVPTRARPTGTSPPEQTSPAIAAVVLENGDDLMGINDLIHLERAGRSIYARTNRRLMADGVTLVDSASTFIGDEVRIEPDAIVHPFTTISGRTSIGSGSVIGPGAHIRDSAIGSNCMAVWSTIEESVVEDDVRIGPYAHLRPGARIGRGVVIGNYAEIKESSLGEGTQVHHFSYIGDARVGRNVNIGAGTVTCNYDGASKHQTVIEDGVFIGSDTMLVAPVTVGEGGATGAGAVVTHDVEPGSKVVGVPARAIRKGDQ